MKKAWNKLSWDINIDMRKKINPIWIIPVTIRLIMCFFLKCPISWARTETSSKVVCSLIKVSNKTILLFFPNPVKNALDLLLLFDQSTTKIFGIAPTFSVPV